MYYNLMYGVNYNMMFSCDLFSSRLKQVREGLTQSQAAQKVGLSQQGWARYESGKVLPGAEAIHQICSSFGISADWLLGLPERSGGITQQATANGPGGQAVALAHGNVVISPGRGEPKDCANCKYKRLAEVIKAAL